MKRSFQAALAAVALVAAGHAAAQITFYEGEGFRGRAFTSDGPVRNFERAGFNDRASSIVVERGRWEVCEHVRFEGRCVVLRRGQYPSLREFGMNNMISSARPLDNGRRHGQADEPQPFAGGVDPQWRRRPNEAVYEVPVVAAHAVVGAPNQRCWVERQQIAQPQAADNNNVGGAVLGGLVGGILGHQVGGGSGKDLATAGGAIAGAVVGSRVAGGNSPAPAVAQRDVQRCETVPSTQVQYWDVTYDWRGVQHHVQMAAQPGRTVLVNGNGEPRQ